MYNNVDTFYKNCKYLFEKEDPIAYENWTNSSILVQVTF
jgi:hypothetical protein